MGFQRYQKRGNSCSGHVVLLAQSILFSLYPVYSGGLQFAICRATIRMLVEYSSLPCPEVAIQFKSDRYQATAIEVIGDDRDTLWQTVIKLNPKQAEHQYNTKRVIPLIWFKRL